MDRFHPVKTGHVSTFAATWVSTISVLTFSLTLPSRHPLSLTISSSVLSSHLPCPIPPPPSIGSPSSATCRRWGNQGAPLHQSGAVCWLSGRRGERFSLQLTHGDEVVRVGLEFLLKPSTKHCNSERVTCLSRVALCSDL